jgi:hypothetical protein
MVHYGYDSFSCSLLLIHSFLTLTLPYQLIVVYRYTLSLPSQLIKVFRYT